MKSEKASDRSSKIARDAKAFHKAINAFGPKFEERILKALRRSAVDEVEQVSRRVMKKAKRLSEKIKEVARITRKEEVVWVIAFATKSDEVRRPFYYSVSAEKFKKVRKNAITRKWLARQREKGASFVQVGVFEKLIKGLKASIRKGKMDERLHRTGEHLIYDQLFSTPTKLKAAKTKTETKNKKRKNKRSSDMSL